MTLNFARLEEIFTAAVAKADPAERSAFLDEACGSEAELRQRIEDLLAADADSATFLPLPQDGTTAIFTPVSERPGSIIGRYKLLEQIGEGGFGLVFMAEQEQPVRRRVALKIIKAGMDTKQVVARFEAERQALAMMGHPHIARVFDGGATETGRPYFVMELVRGVPITEYCDEARLTTHERLALFQSVCAAIQHAHQKGIIHRDLKPSNVLVTMHDDKAVPKVIDFGVAKATQGRLTERTLFTEFRAMIGTPNYMSPEQAHMSGLDVDTRSDIYSLGVLLYELLTGTTPIDSKKSPQATYDDLRRMICEEEPPKPSARLSALTAEQLTTLARQRHCEPTQLAVGLRSELDWIVMKCLEKDRTRRYESASALANDLQRYLANEPVEACPPSVGYRFGKFARRNKTLLTASSAIVGALVIGLGLATWMYFREREAHRQAEFGSQILDVANPYHGNSPEEAELFLASLAPLGQRMDPQNRAKLYYRFGDLRGRQVRWKESAAYFAEGLKLESNQFSFEPWHYYLPVLIQSGDLEGYHRMREELLKRFTTTSDPRIAECVVKDSLITPWPDADFDVLESLLDRALHAEEHWAREYFQFAKALLEYRRANYESAVRYARQGNSTSDSHLIISAAMVRAMAHHQLGEVDEARRLLTYGLDFAQARYSREALLMSNRNWSDWIITHALMDEASTVIEPKLLAEIPKSLATSSHPIVAVDNLYYLALEKLRSGDEVGYRKACAVLDLVPECSDNTVTEFRRNWTWCLGPHPDEDLGAPLQHAEQLLANNLLEDQCAEHLVHGAILYRTSQFEAAAEHLETSVAGYPNHPPFYLGTIDYPRLLLSMVRWHLGQRDEARSLLAKSQAPVHRAIESPLTLWDCRVTIEVLHREAEALIQPDKAAPYSQP